MRRAQRGGKRPDPLPILVYGFLRTGQRSKAAAAPGAALTLCSSEHYVSLFLFCQEPTRIIACLINIECHSQLLGFSHYQVPPSFFLTPLRPGPSLLSFSCKPWHFCFGVFRPPATWPATQAPWLHPSPQSSWLQSWAPVTHVPGGLPWSLRCLGAAL